MFIGKRPRIALYLPPDTYVKVCALSEACTRQHGMGTEACEIAWQSGLEELLGKGVVEAIKVAGATGVELRENRYIEDGTGCFVDLNAVLQ